MDRLLGAFLEACHDGPSELVPWCTAVADTLTPLIAADEGLAVWVGDQGMRGSTVVARGRADVMLGPRWPQPTAIERRRASKGTWRSAVATAQQILGAHGAQKFCVPFGFVNGIALTSIAGPIQLGLLMPLREHEQRSPRERILHRAQRHLQSAFAARTDASWAETADLIIGEGGRVRHAKPNAERLRRLALQIAALPDAGFGMADRADPAPARLWNALLAGHWKLASVTDTDGQRMLVLRRDRASAAELLTARERDVLRAAASGVPSKYAANELGVCVTTFSTHLGRAMRKLGIRDRSQLLHVTGSPR